MTTFNLNLKSNFCLLCLLAYYNFFVFGTAVFLIFSTYLILYTNLYWLPFLYVIWVIYDRKTPDRGGRSIEWFRNLGIWDYVAEYFPMNIVKISELEPQENYMFCIHPHGVYFTGSFCLWGQNKKFRKQFPGINLRHLTAPWCIKWNLITRDLYILQGLCSSAENSIRYLLSKPGNSVLLSIGGTEEVPFAKPGVYKFYIKRRKGFARLALLHGTSLVPVIIFGENEMFNTVSFQEGTVMKWFFDKVYQITGTNIVIPFGRWFLIPFKIPLFIVVGSPIKVQKVTEPTDEQIEAVKKRYIQGISQLFEREKYKYLKDPENTFLEIV